MGFFSILLLWDGTVGVDDSSNHRGVPGSIPGQGFFLYRDC